MRASWIVIGASLVIASTAALADPVYRWTDAQGVVSYGERPPEHATDVRQLQVSSAASFTSTAAEDEKLADAYAKSRQERASQDAADAKAAAARAKAEAKALAAQHKNECYAGTSSSDCSDVTITYYPVIGARRPYDPIVAPAKPAAPAPVVNHPSLVPVQKSGPVNRSTTAN
jgi:hypothetical protein